MFCFGDEEVRAFERARFDTEGMSERRPELDGVVYLLCLEPGAPPAPDESPFETVLNTVIQAAQPAPSIMHVELILPPTPDCADGGFGTYLGTTANWSRSFGDPRSFYLGRTASSWRAVPVVAPNAAGEVRDECAKHLLTPYSLGRYACAVPPMRAMAGALSDRVGAPAHCATLAARVLRRALPTLALPHASAWFGPATLFLELSSASRRAAARARLHAGAQRVRGDGEEAQEDAAMTALLHGDDDAVRALDHDACVMGLHRLTMRALEDGLDDVALRIVQKQLAVALLRASVVRG